MSIFMTTLLTLPLPRCLCPVPGSHSFHSRRTRPVVNLESTKSQSACDGNVGVQHTKSGDSPRTRWTSKHTE